MPSRMLVALAALAAAAPAAAQGFRGVEPYGPAYGGDAGYAGEFLRGTYIGAPLTRVPRPTQIVPSPWSYGTYGVPTVSGIPAAATAPPTLTVINGRTGYAGDGRTAGLHVIDVRVPRR